MNVEELAQKQGDEQERQHRLANRIYCCTAAGCVSCGADNLKKAIADEIVAQGRQSDVEVCGTGCMGLCSKGPLVRSSDDGAIYGNLEASDAAALVSAKVEDRQLLADRRIEPEAPFFKKQQKIVLANAGYVDPETLADYIAAGGYQALARISHKEGSGKPNLVA